MADDHLFNCENGHIWDHACTLQCICRDCRETLLEHLFALIREIDQNIANNLGIITDEVNFPSGVK